MRKRSTMFPWRSRLLRELQESEERYRLLFHNTPIGIFFYDTDLVVTECNQRFADMLRSTRERLLGLDMKTLRDQSPLPAIREALLGREGRYEGPYVSTTGESRLWASLRTAPLFDAQGRIVGGAGILEDVTERVNMQRELEERELFLRRLTDNMLDLISQIDARGRFVYLSPSNERVLGYRPKDLLGTRALDLVHPDDLPAVADAYDKAAERMVPDRVEFRARRADGTYLWVESLGNPLRDEEGRLTGAIFVTRDISERKRMQERLERLNRCFLELGPDPLENIVRLVEVTREIMETLLAHYSRLHRGKLLFYASPFPGGEGRGFRVRENPEGLICYRVIKDSAERPMAFEDIAPEESRNLGFPLSEEPRSYLGYPIRVEGRTVGCLGVYRSRPGPFSPEEVDLLGMLARAVQGEEVRFAHHEELRDFVDIASHELRHPMTIIKGYAATLRRHMEKMDHSTVMDILEDIEKGADRLERIVYNLLDTARIERGKMTLEKRMEDPRPLLENAVREMREKWPQTPILLRLEGPLRPRQLDAEKFGQVLVILLDNAVNYSPPESPVEVEASSGEEGQLTVSVLDRGIGVPEEERDRIFDRFHQVGDAAHHSSEGLGLGLYIAREIVSAHGGRIWYEPRPGGGSVFRFTI